MVPGEYAEMRSVSVRAFGGDEAIGSLLDSLRRSWSWADDLAFVAEAECGLVGQILYTQARLDTIRGVVPVLLLSPLGVVPEHQTAGLGERLVRDSLTMLRGRPESLVFLEGHPGYYPRFGFRCARDLGFAPPSIRIPDPAFQVLMLPSWQPWMIGALVYPDAYWEHNAVVPAS